MNKYSAFFDEIFSRPMILEESGLLKYIPFIQAIKEGKIINFPDKPVLKMGLFDELMNRIADNNEEQVNGVAVIPVSGVMTRAGSWWDYGTDEIAGMINDAWNDASILAVVIKENTPGGSVDSIFPLKAVMAKKNKPVICAVDSSAMSCGYFLASYCDKIIAVDDMASVGSIGVQATIYNRDEMYQQYGMKVLTITPPESKWKNKPFNDAQGGNYDLLIKEELTPWAQYFQSVVRANRPNLNESVEGTLEGRTFFANYTDVNAKVNGLIDDVMPFDKIISYAFDMAKNQQIKQLFK